MITKRVTIKIGKLEIIYELIVEKLVYLFDHVKCNIVKT